MIKRAGVPSWLSRIGLLLISATLLVMLTVIPGHAFDGKRKGFVAGIGLGFTPASHWSTSNDWFNVTENGLAGNGLIGYAWDNSNMIVYEGNGSMYKTSSLNDKWVIQGLDGPRWYHYWGAGDNRFFTVVGVGMMILATQYCDIDGRGFGVSTGLGLELTKQVQVGAYFIGGHTSNDYGIKANHEMLTLVVTMVAY
jgi:hypothetical protein